jgi:precorrin-6B methylase 2
MPGSAVQQVIEKCLEVKKRVITAFVDLETAYEKVDRSKLWGVLEECGVV